MASGPENIAGAMLLGQKGETTMWVLVVIALHTQMAFSIPGYSSEQTCSAKGKETIEFMRDKKGGNWIYHCVRPE